MCWPSLDVVASPIRKLARACAQCTRRSQADCTSAKRDPGQESLSNVDERNRRDLDALLLSGHIRPPPHTCPGVVRSLEVARQLDSTPSSTHDTIWQRGCVDVIQENEQMFAISNWAPTASAVQLRTSVACGHHPAHCPRLEGWCGRFPLHPPRGTQRVSHRTCARKAMLNFRLPPSAALSSIADREIKSNAPCLDLLQFQIGFLDGASWHAR